jgi:hypothetical protein
MYYMTALSVERQQGLTGIYKNNVQLDSFASRLSPVGLLSTRMVFN